MLTAQDRIVVTGAAGFIGSYFLRFLKEKGFANLIAVDDFSNAEKSHNLIDKKDVERVHREQFEEWLETHKNSITHIFHFGARTDTTEMDYEVHKKWNLDYSKMVWNKCVEQDIKLVYASSAATYGNGEFGYFDNHELPAILKPLNPYGESKNNFDIWALELKKQPKFWAGVKFFNVFGPNEYHKGRMASVIFHAYRQIVETGGMKLFRSHHPDFKDGEQKRDFIYVSDVAKLCFWLMDKTPENGLYNVGTGQARTFLDLGKAVFSALDLPENIEFIDTPIDIRDNYQYYTEAEMTKVFNAGYEEEFYTLEEAIKIYIQDFLKEKKYY